MAMRKVEYRVRPVTRYVLTKFEDGEDGDRRWGGCETIGEFVNIDSADRVGIAMRESDRGSTFATIEDRREPCAIVYAYTHEDATKLMAAADSLGLIGEQ